VKATFQIWRSEPGGAGAFKSYTTEISEGMVVLDAVHKIQAEQAPDMACRWNCKAGKCGSCSAEINGKPRLMCMSRLNSLDLDQPVAVLMVAVLHFVGDHDDPFGAVARIRDRLASGSHLVLSHASAEGRPEAAARHRELYSRTPTPMTMRSRDEIARFFDGFDLIDPGLVWLPLWRPEDPSAAAEQPERTTGFAGVGRCR